MYSTTIERYLLERDYINREQFQETLALQHEINIPWASLSYVHKYLNPEDIETIEHVMEKKAQNFFITAVEFELLSMAETEYLHTCSRHTWMYFADALLLENRFSLSQVITFGASYQDFIHQSEKQRPAELQKHIAPEEKGFLKSSTLHVSTDTALHCA